MQAFGDSSSTTNIPQKLEKFLTPPQTEDKYGQTTISISSSSAHSEHNTPSYIESLKEERKLLSSHSELTHVFDLIDKEIKRLSNAEQVEAAQAAAQASKDPSLLSKTLLVPVELYPNYNFVGRILGPRGTTAKQLETATGCKIIIHGRKASGTGSSVATANEPLSVELTCSASLPDAAQKLEMGVSVIEALLVPPADGQDELKRQQLMILANMNGTYRPRSAAAIAAAAANSTASGGVGDYQFENLLPFGYRLPTVGPNCHHEKMVKSLLSMGLPNSKPPIVENTDCSNPRCAVFRNLLGNEANHQHGSLTKFEDVLNAMQLYEVINRIRISESSANFGRKLNVQRK
ncbi:unnamed protein product [Caenorhabditis angaria]|uniref:K Homology domain-containing protein n=1 Tax=Caenorhabditis angaria TaxID=860376 RepID=A0A9P1MVL7_9PELO|nr:unnamed protein product [Caenorhabditis angaria]